MVAQQKKEHAITLRKSGKSYREIERILTIPRSTLSEWFRPLPWSRKVQRILVQRGTEWRREHMRKVGSARARVWKARRAAAREGAIRLHDQYAKDPLFVAGLMLYWSEGDNKATTSQVRLTNTHPSMIAIFSRFLQKYCSIPVARLRVGLILYPDLNDNLCKQHWSQRTGIPMTQFIKSTFIRGRHPTNRLVYGIGTVYVTSCELKEKILQWITLYQDRLLR